MSRQRFVLAFLFAAACFGGAFCGWEDQAAHILDDPGDYNFLNQLSELKEDFQKLDKGNDKGSDKAVAWKELKLAMQLLNHARRNYSGLAKDDLNRVQEITDNMVNDYRKTTVEMFGWAVAGTVRLKLMVRYKERFQNISLIKEFAGEMFTKGLSLTDQAITELTQISHSLIELQFRLKRIKLFLKFELNDFKNDEQWHFTKLFYDQMCAALEIAALSGARTRQAMDEETNFVEQLQGKLHALRDMFPILFEEDFHELIFEMLEEFANSLDEYVKRHSGGESMEFQDDVVARYGDDEKLTMTELTNLFQQAIQTINAFIEKTKQKERF